MKKSFILIYLVGFTVLFLFCAMIWHWQMAGNYFVCHHSGLIVDFLPPFIHQGRDGDAFFKPRRAVYAIWLVYVGTIALVPGVAAWLLTRLHDKELKNSWK